MCEWILGLNNINDCAITTALRLISAEWLRL